MNKAENGSTSEKVWCGIEWVNQRNRMQMYENMQVRIVVKDIK